MTNELTAIEAEALAAIAAADDLKALEDADTAYLGRRAGKLTGLMRLMGTLPAEQKPLFGQAFNAAKTRVETALAERRDRLTAAERAERERAETIDITLPGRARPQGRLHPLTLAMEEFKRVMIGLGFEFVDGPDIEDYKYNFEWLNFPPDHPAMDEQDTFYLRTGDDSAERYLLRTQTTALQGRFFETGRKPPFRIATIGRCFRNEDMDETHSHTFHQVDGFSVAEGVSLADLKGVLTEIYRGIFGPDAVVRFRPDFFPFVEPGVEVAVRWVDPRTGNARWLEMGGAGLIHPNILRHAGFDPERYTGFAFGLGIDRMPMRRYGIDDLRLFLENDLRFLQQF
ncbi:MAG: phenylalanine--tRNA ligase subunit alpha [Capsulimonadales bacterium]|nr:phenylalanine--tRNA ligase subunit alpha [Capsulimonadales bacterium]